MRKTVMALVATSMAIPTIALPSAADAKHRHSYYNNGYHGRSYAATTCRRRDGTTGALIGGAGGAVAGNVIGGGTAGTLIGAGAGALLGRHLERHGSSRRCR